MVQLQKLDAPEDHSHKENNIEAVVGQKSFGKGILYISNDKLYWIAEVSSGQGDGATNGFYLLYPQIALHAVCKDRSVHSKDHLYLVIEDSDKGAPPPVTINGEGEVNGGSGDADADKSDEDSDEEDVATTVKFIPDNSDALSAMYEAMCACQSLHPDPADLSEDSGDNNEEEEEEVGSEFIGTENNPEIKFDEDGQLVLYPQSANRPTEDKTSAMEVEDGQFEDA